MPRDSGHAEPADLLSDGGLSIKDRSDGTTHISWDHDKDSDKGKGWGWF